MKYKNPPKPLLIHEPHELPEMRLLRAVLKIAALDYLSNGKGLATISQNHKANARQAKNWLFSDPLKPDAPPFSFCWVCQHLTSDYLAFALRFRAALTELKSKQENSLDGGEAPILVLGTTKVA